MRHHALPAPAESRSERRLGPLERVEWLCRGAVLGLLIVWFVDVVRTWPTPEPVAWASPLVVTLITAAVATAVVTEVRRYRDRRARR